MQRISFWMKVNRWVPVLALATTAPLLAGCGNSGLPLASVTGQVQLDGAPLPDAVVEFQPPGSSPSYGKTDANGEFELKYTRDKPGALIGKHTVKITSGAYVTDEQGEEHVRPEVVPLRYNDQTELTRLVEQGGNEFTFELQSGGPVRTTIE
jgi:hypothetical protein